MNRNTIKVVPKIYGALHCDKKYKKDSNSDDMFADIIRARNKKTVAYFITVSSFLREYCNFLQFGKFTC